LKNDLLGLPGESLFKIELRSGSPWCGLALLNFDFWNRPKLLRKQLNLTTSMSDNLLEFKSTDAVLHAAFELWDVGSVPSFADVAALSQIFREQYGDRYHTYVLERPDIVRRMITHGEWIGFVVREPGGEILGHGGLLPNGSRCFKFARAIVTPRAQGFGVHSFLTRMRLSYLEELAVADRVSVSATDAVTSHPATQRVFEGKDFFPVGVYFGKFNDYFDKGYRETVVRYQYLFDPVVRTERTLFAPKEYWPLIEQIAEWSGCYRKFYESSRPASPSGQALFKLDTQDFDTMQSLTYWLDADGSCLPLLNNLEQQRLRGVQFVSVSVQLCHASACEQIRILRSQGFGFGGVEFMPYGDVLWMQWSGEWSTSQLAHWAPLQPLAQKLVEGVLAIDKR
jgi:hypothetical protein